MLSSVPCQFYELPFEVSMMDRKLIVCSVNERLVVCTAHFESLFSAKARVAQMEQTFGVIRGFQNCVVAGDYNFDSEDSLEGKCFRDNSMQDICKAFLPDDTFTMYKTPQWPAWRPDKIITRSD